MENVQLTVNEGIATLVINRPKQLNALNKQTLAEISEAFESMRNDDGVKVVIMTGSGEKAFVAGADIKEFANFSGVQGSELAKTGHMTVFNSIEEFSKPVIAAINGAAAGLGLVQALMCDMRFAADTAKFTVAFSKRGLIGEYGISWVLPRLVGQANALDLMMSSRVVMANEAQQMGMVNKVVPADQLMDVVLAYAADLAMNVSPSSMAVMKRQVYSDYEKDVSSASKEALRLMQESFTRSDFKEGVQSFLQKRQAEFPPVHPNA
mgnify:CR=1 FL=1